ncbi:MAG: hypothetical protein GY940_04945, partial [bacterium]|nr:hypothetical protein [bacterium]
MVLNKKPKKTLMTVLIFIIPFLTCLEVFADSGCNESDTCFNEGTGAVASPAGIKGSADYIRQYIAEGAGDMLLSYSQTLLFLNRVEMSGPEKTDFAILHTLIENSSVQLEKAKNTWNRLIMAADNTPYNPDVITKLEELDYTGFQMDRSSTINKDVFDTVAN